jgi:hypothetical protein
MADSCLNKYLILNSIKLFHPKFPYSQVSSEKITFAAKKIKLMVLEAKQDQGTDTPITKSKNATKSKGKKSGGSTAAITFYG